MRIDLIADIRAAEKQMENTLAIARQSIVDATKKVTDDIKKDLRGEVLSAGLGDRLSKTWRSKFYGANSFGCAGMIFTKAPELIRAFTEGARIRSANGFWLAIPTENAPKRGVGGKRISPSNFPEHVYGNLQFVYRPTGVSLLVVNNMRASYSRKTGQFRGFKRASDKAIGRGRGLTSVVMFLLVPEVSLRPRLNPDEIVSRNADKVPNEISVALERLRNAKK